MTGFNKNSQSEVAKFVLENLPRHKEFVLATIGQDDLPWVVCLNLTIDNGVNIIWQSKKDTEHSKHIALNPHVSLCIFSNTELASDFGFYAKGVAHEVKDAIELGHCLDYRFTRKEKLVPAPDDFSGDAEYRMYVAELHEAWVTDEEHLKTPIDLDVLKSAAEELWAK